MKRLNTLARQMLLALVLILLPAASALAAAGMTWDTPDQGIVMEAGNQVSFNTVVNNTGTDSDNFTVTQVSNLPYPDTDWWDSMCVDGFCYDPGVSVVDFNLRRGASAALDVDIIAAVGEGVGECIVTVTSDSDPTVTETRIFKVVTTGIEVLIVDSDGGETYETYYVDAIAAAGKSYGVWDRQELEALSNTELENFEAVIWATGTHQPGLAMDDFTALGYFVQHGGGLMLSGQDLLYGLCDPASPHHNPSADSWFNIIAGVDYLADDSGGSQVSGVAGDLIAGGHTFQLGGGDGADNNTSPDRIGAVGPGALSMDYNTVSAGAVKAVYGSGSSYVCGFGFESIAAAADRTFLMGQVLAYFAGELVPADLVEPLLVRAPQAAPNPFNPQTAIKFVVGGDENVPVDVVVYDLKGQAVRHLFSGPVQPGPVSLTWNGRDNGNRVLSAGLYLARVDVAGLTSTVKMTLAK